VLDRQLARADAPLRFGTLVIVTDGTDRAARVLRDDLMAAVDATEHDIWSRDRLSPKRLPLHAGAR
jgi:hypothetical protein